MHYGKINVSGEWFSFFIIFFVVVVLVKITKVRFSTLTARRLYYSKTSKQDVTAIAMVSVCYKGPFRCPSGFEITSEIRLSFGKPHHKFYLSRIVSHNRTRYRSSWCVYTALRFPQSWLIYGEAYYILNDKIHMMYSVVHVAGPVK